MANPDPDRPPATGPGAWEASGRRAASNGLSNLITQAVYAVCQLVVVWLLATSLSRPELGEYYFLFSLVMAVQWVAECGIGTILSCRIAAATGSRDRIVGEAAGAVRRNHVALSIVAIALIGASRRMMGGECQSGRSWRRPAPAARSKSSRYCTGILRGFETFARETVAAARPGPPGPRPDAGRARPAGEARPGLLDDRDGREPRRWPR